MEFQKDQIVENVLPGANNRVLVCRVVEKLDMDGVEMYRLTDARETRSDKWLIAHNRTWAAPVENIRIPEDSPVCHKTGLVYLGGN